MTENVAVFDKEKATLKKKVEELEGRLNDTRGAIDNLKNQSVEATREYLSLKELYRFVGNIEKYLEEIKSLEESGNVTQRLLQINERIVTIKKQIDFNAIKARKESALKSIGLLISNYLSILEAEHRDKPVTLDIANLTLKISSPSGREDYLWEIGSGANYMAYHLSTLLALHTFFLTSQKSPVPSFLVVDQPSQVYFPEGFSDIESLKKRKTKKAEKEKIDRDLFLTQKIFDALNQAFLKTNKKLQIIVVEHAGTLAWKDVKHNINVVANWHNEKDALIPSHWLK